jgi:hypothetical protein
VAAVGVGYRERMHGERAPVRTAGFGLITLVLLLPR